jgi:hypothetical protein
MKAICMNAICMKAVCRPLLILLLPWSVSPWLSAQAGDVPAWAYPGSATHVQVAPPADFHRPSRNFDTPIGMFQGQSDIGGALVPGSASYDAATKQYTIHSAGYNVWYTRDEFRYLWKKMSGDVSLAADISYPDATGYGDRKAVLVIRQDLDDDSKEALVALHGCCRWCFSCCVRLVRVRRFDLAWQLCNRNDGRIARLQLQPDRDELRRLHQLFHSACGCVHSRDPERHGQQLRVGGQRRLGASGWQLNLGGLCRECGPGRLRSRVRLLSVHHFVYRGWRGRL